MKNRESRGVGRRGGGERGGDRSGAIELALVKGTAYPSMLWQLLHLPLTTWDWGEMERLRDFSPRIVLSYVSLSQFEKCCGPRIVTWELILGRKAAEAA